MSRKIRSALLIILAVLALVSLSAALISGPEGTETATPTDDETSTGSPDQSGTEQTESGDSGGSGLLGIGSAVDKAVLAGKKLLDRAVKAAEKAEEKQENTRSGEGGEYETGDEDGGQSDDWSSIKAHDQIKYRIDSSSESVRIGETASVTVTVKNMAKNTNPVNPSFYIHVNGKRMGRGTLGLGASISMNPTSTETFSFKVSGKKDEGPYDLTPGTKELVIGEETISGSTGSGELKTAFDSTSIELEKPVFDSNPVKLDEVWILGSGNLRPPTRPVYRVRAENTGPVAATISPEAASFRDVKAKDLGSVYTCTNKYSNRGCKDTQEGEILLEPGESKWVFFEPKLTADMLYELGYRLYDTPENIDIAARYKTEVPMTGDSWSEEVTTSQKVYNTFRFPFRNHGVDDFMAENFDKINVYNVNVNTQVGDRVDKDSENVRIHSKWNGELRDIAEAKDFETGVNKRIVGHENGQINVIYREVNRHVVGKKIDTPPGSGGEPTEVSVQLDVPDEKYCDTDLQGTVYRDSQEDGRVRVFKGGKMIEEFERVDGPGNAEYMFHNLELACDSQNRVVYREKVDGAWKTEASSEFLVPRKEPGSQTVDLYPASGKKECFYQTELEVEGGTTGHLKTNYSTVYGEEVVDIERIEAANRTMKRKLRQSCGEARLTLTYYENGQEASSVSRETVDIGRHLVESEGVKKARYSFRPGELKAIDPEPGISLSSEKVTRGEDIAIVAVIKGTGKISVGQEEEDPVMKESFQDVYHENLETRGLEKGDYKVTLRGDGLSSSLRRTLPGFQTFSKSREFKVQGEKNGEIDALWERYCSENGYSPEVLEEKRNCISFKIVPLYFDSGSGSNPEIADSLCQDILGYSYSPSRKTCLPEE